PVRPRSDGKSPPDVEPVTATDFPANARNLRREDRSRRAEDLLEFGREHVHRRGQVAIEHGYMVVAAVDEDRVVTADELQSVAAGDAERIVADCRVVVVAANREGIVVATDDHSNAVVAEDGGAVEFAVDSLGLAVIPVQGGGVVEAPA